MSNERVLDEGRCIQGEGGLANSGIDCSYVLGSDASFR